MKQYIPIIIGISLPIVLILVIMGVIFLPRIVGPKPQYNFIYAVQNNSAPMKVVKNVYSVDSGKIIVQTSTTTDWAPSQQLMLYDVGRDSTKEITLADAQAYRVNTESRSPDGFTLEYRYNNAGIFELFGGGNNNRGWVLSRGASSVPLTVQGNDYYSGNIVFIGWVVEAK